MEHSICCAGLLRRPARAARLPLWQRLLVLRVRDRRADRALFLFLHRFVKFLELLLFARQVFGEGGVIKVCDVGMDRFHQPQKALILDQLAEALAKCRNTMSMPASRQVWTFGRLAQRCVSVTQRPLSFPPRMCSPTTLGSPA